MPDLANEAARNAYLAAGGLAVACGLLSVFVVARRWAFLGEGISHSGFGGAGTAWLLAVLWPGVFDTPAMPYALVVVFCFIAAVSIGAVGQARGVSSDAAIGVFLVASLAWGFVGQHAYAHAFGRNPVGFDNFLYGQVRHVGNAYTAAAVGVTVIVVACVWLLGKELIAYCFDPLLAHTSGVPATGMHYLLLLLLTLVIVVGSRVVGSVLVTALLVLPAVTANLLTQRLGSAFAVAVGVSLAGAWGGLLLAGLIPAVPAGSMIVLAMFAIFVVAFVTAKVRGTA
ncbi:MAG TPA: metal ABC transporter permease [Tepidisphaeraceae bacterium]|jgi:ABC-type Mn2+/Zn2+ transport system permease subunit